MSFLVEFHLGPHGADTDWTHFATRVDLLPPPPGTRCSVVSDKPLRGLDAGACIEGAVSRVEYREADQVMLYRVMLDPVAPSDASPAAV
jgi:hypothetical protein